MMSADYCEIQVGGHRRNSKRYVALVDVADVATVEGYCWYMDRGYVKRNARAGGKRTTVYLHREILGLGPGDPDVDHIHGNKLDNRRENLRPCTDAQNNQNLHHCGSYRGVTWHAGAKRWMAQTQLEKKNHYLGLYDTPEEAAAASAVFRCQHMPYSSDARTHKEM
jgi:hypothetical protein